MRPAHERSQECLPPKKRDLPGAASHDAARLPPGAANHAPPGDGPAWARVAGARSPAPPPPPPPPPPLPPRYGPGGEGAASGPGAEAGPALEPYGLLYKVAVPPTAFPPPVVSMSPLPPAFGVASSLLPHTGVPYPPLHYAQLPPASLQLVGPHYTVPYAVPPGFLPGPLLSPSAGLGASHVPHFVPYASLLTEETAVSPPTTSPAHAFSKPASALSPSGQVQHHHAGAQPLDIAQGRLPVYYHMSRLPPGFSAYEMPAATGSPDPPAQENQLNSEATSANGGQRHLEHHVARRTGEAVDCASGKAEAQLCGAAMECVLDGQFLSGYQTLRTEVSVPAHRSTPDADLEVQRVVGVLASQDYPILAAQKKDGLSPLNLCHNIPDQQGESGDLWRNPMEAAAAAAAAEKNQSRSPYAMSPEEPVRHRQLTKGMAIANGKPVLVPVGSESIRSSASETLIRQSPNTLARGNMLDKDLGPVQPPSSSHLPSHFMKGAIIQLATGELKRVEDLQTQDFVRSAEVSGGLKIDSSTVVDIQESQWPGFVMLHFVVGEQQSKVSIDVPPEHPFFVYGQGWSSCSPARTAQLFSLPCHRLQVGDVCISISLQNMNGNSASQATCPPATQLVPARERADRMLQGSREHPPAPLHGERKSQAERDSTAHGACAETSQPEPGGQYGWAAPSFQRCTTQGEEPRPSLLRPSFIPQEVKLSIEGRSNAGK